MIIDRMSRATGEEALAVLERRGGEARPRARALAMGRLGALGGKRHAEVAAQHLRDRREDVRVRVEAALALGRGEHPQRGKLLAQQLKEPEEVVRYAALQALAFYGGPDTYEAVRAAVPTLGDGYVAAGAQLAQTLIAYRNGLAEGTLRAPRGVRPTGTGPKATDLALSKRPLRAEAARKLHAGVGAVALAVEPSLEHTYGLECGLHPLGVIMDRAFDAPGSLERFAKQKCVVLAVVDQDVEPEMYSPSFHLLSHPGTKPNTVELNAIDLRGRRIMTGMGKLEGGRLTFELTPLEVPRTFPMAVRGSFEPGGRGLVFDEAKAGRQRIEDGRPRIPQRA